jgi:hypothetical protein
MLGSWLFPLAPAAGLLLSAFLLFGVAPLLPGTWRGRWGISVPVIIGLCLLSVLFVPLSAGVDDLTKGLTLLSGWNFSTTESVAALTARVDATSLPFLIVTFLVLLAVTLLTIDVKAITEPNATPTRVLGWLLLGATACALFAAANGLTILYAVVAFDVAAALYWLSYGQRDAGVGRLFLGVFTGAVLVLASFAPDNGGQLGAYALGFVLWLRLALFPVAEYAASKTRHDDDRLTYLALTQLVGLFLVARLVQQPLPPVLLWLVAASMLLGGLSTWFTNTLENGAPSDELTPTRLRNVRTRLIAKLGLTLGLLPLLAAPLSLQAVTAFAAGLTLSIVALWATPALGRPKFSEGAWSWPYLPAVMSTATLVGVPFSLGWYFREFSYQSIFRVESVLLLLLVATAEALALSGLVPYWRWLVHTNEQSFRRSVVGILAMVPFLTPGLGPFILYSMIELEQFFQIDWETRILVLLIGPVVLAVLLGLNKGLILRRLNFSPTAVSEFIFDRHWLNGAEALFYLLSRLVLRIQLVLEGQHYIGWAVFTALVGAIIIFLS